MHMNTLYNKTNLKEVFMTRERILHGLEHIKQVKRLYSAKKPTGGFSKSDLYLRDFKFMRLLHRVQSLEDKFSHDTPIYEVLEVHETGEIFRSYFEIHMIPDFEVETTLRGVKKNDF